MKRQHLNAGLLVVAAGLGTAVYFSQEKEKVGPPLTALAGDAITHIVIEHPDAPAIRLEKQDGRWRLAAPVKGEVDDFEIAALLNLATAATQAKIEGAKPEDLGLAPPKYSITLNDQAIAFGGTEPLQFHRYVQAGGATWTIEDPPSAALDKDWSDLVAKNLVPAGSEIERIELPQLALAKADGKWSLMPADPKAGADQLQKLADAWKNARAMWNEAATGPAPRGERVRVTLKGGEVREFIVAAREPQFKLHRADLGVNFVLSKALAEEMLQLPAPAPEPPK
ncbi:MAG TPA: DUF4340 domain-containing protein [Verrucomicrobiae bacterium]|nr:DUF4340 domain-containing protein [Verrucomicrobiae bacterium]